MIANRLIVTKADSNAHTPWLRGDDATRWQLLEPFRAGDVLVPEGYIFNGSSVPRPLWWLFPPTYAPAWEASCVHDYCYSHYWPHIDKRDADRLLRHVMAANGASKLTCWLFYSAVRLNVNGGGWRGRRSFTADR